jgi:hypothetical protein
MAGRNALCILSIGKPSEYPWNRKISWSELRVCQGSDSQQACRLDEGDRLTPPHPESEEPRNRRISALIFDPPEQQRHSQVGQTGTNIEQEQFYH